MVHREAFPMTAFLKNSIEWVYALIENNQKVLKKIEKYS